MFGTLVYGMQHEEPTFIENTSESVINRNRRGKPHVACGYCRARKLRCNGDPLGCDRCKFSSNICSYPKHRNNIRKNKSSDRLTGETPKSPQPTRDDDDAEASSSPAFSDSCRLDPDLPFSESNQAHQEHQSITDISMLQKQDVLLTPSSSWGFESPVVDRKDCSNSLLQTEQDTDQIDQWLVSCTHLSPNTSMNTLTTVEGGDFPSTWEELGDNTSYHDLLDDSGTDDLSSQGTQPDIDHTDVTENTSTPGLSTSNMFLNERFTTHHSMMPQEYQTMPNEAQRGQRATPVAYKMSAPPMSLLLESVGTRKKENKCHCLRLAAHMLEQLGNEAANTEVPIILMDRLLNRCQEAVKGCGAILKCTYCNPRSESMMLLAMTGQYLSDICKMIVRCYIDFAQLRHSLDSPFAGGPAIRFQSYKVESRPEQVQILWLLVRGQLTEVYQLIRQVKSKVGVKKSHLAPLLRAERKVQRLKALLIKLDSRRPVSDDVPFEMG